jgi:hypothetical protein
MDPVPPQSNDFERLQRLLALKRHESPPPGFFGRFPDQVRARIARAEAEPAPWWRQWMEILSFNPAMATAYAAGATLLVVGGFWWSRPAVTGNPQLANGQVVPVDTNQAGVLIASNAPPPGLFRTPSLPVQPAEFKR